MARLLAIAATDAEAEAVARKGAEWTVGGYAGGKGGPHGHLEYADRVDRYVDEVIVHGSPAKVVEKLRSLQEEQGIDYLLASLLSHETFMRLTDEVLPEFL